MSAFTGRHNALHSLQCRTSVHPIAKEILYRVSNLHSARKSIVFGWVPGHMVSWRRGRRYTAKEATLHGHSLFGLALGNDAFPCAYRVPSLFLATREPAQRAKEMQAVKP